MELRGWMFGPLTGERVAVRSSGEVDLDTILAEGVRGPRPDVSALAAREAGRLAPLGDPRPVRVAGHTVTIATRLPRQSVSLTLLTWER